MGSLIVLLAITLSIILFASYREVQIRNKAMLERYADLFFLEQLPEEKPGSPNDTEYKPGSPEDTGAGPQEGAPPLDERPDYQLSTFYSVAISNDGTVLAVDDGGRGVYDQDELAQIAKELLEKNRAAGKKGNLRYLISDKGDYTLVAFMDNTVTDSSLHMLLRNVLVIGGLALLALFFISLFLSKRIIRPLEENDRAQKQFISDAGHELKTPVSVISANAEMLAREVGDNEWLSNIQYENDRMGELVHQLLDLSRAENADIPMEQVDFSRVVTGEVLAFESLAFDQGRTIQSNVEEGLIAAGRKDQLTQLVSVLIDNAIRHSTGEVIEVRLKGNGNTAVLDVMNPGDEIPVEQRDHLFDRFYRMDEARSGEGQHYGLGLAIAKAVAERHGGSIGVSCAEGKVIFTVQLPLEKR